MPLLHRKKIKNLLHKAHSLFLKKQFNELIIFLKPYLIKERKNFHIYYLIGAAYEEMHKIELSYIFYSVCAKINSKNENILIKLYQQANFLERGAMEKIKILNSLLKIHQCEIYENERMKICVAENFTEKIVEYEIEKGNGKSVKSKILEMKNLTGKTNLLTKLLKKTDDEGIINILFSLRAYRKIIYLPQKIFEKNIRYLLIFFIANEKLKIIYDEDNYANLDNIVTFQVQKGGKVLVDVFKDFEMANKNLYFRLFNLCVKRKSKKSLEFFEFLYKQNLTDQNKNWLLYKKTDILENNAEKIKILLILHKIYKKNDKILHKISLTYEKMGNFLLAYEYANKIKNNCITDEIFMQIYEETLFLYEKLNLEKKEHFNFLKKSRQLIKNIYANKNKNFEDGTGIILRHCEILFLNDYTEDALKILYGGLFTHSMKKNHHHFFLSIFYGLKFSLQKNNFNFFYQFIKKIFLRTDDFSVIFLTNFLNNFISDFHKKNEWRRFSAFFIKIILREKLDEKIIFFYLNFLCTNKIFSASFYKIEKIIDKYLLSDRIKIMYASFLLSFSVSRKIKNRNCTVKKAFEIIKDVESEELRIYNLARAYQFYNLNGLAEREYKKLLHGKNNNIKQSACINLNFMHKKNK